MAVELEARPDILSVPPTTVFAVNGKDFVSGVDDGKIVRRPVQVGLRTAEAVEIQSGLSEQDMIVGATPAAFSPGRRPRTACKEHGKAVDRLARMLTMFFRSHTPSRPLADFIERFWLCSDDPAHRRERILPSGTIELVINLREDEIRIYDALIPDRCRRLSGAVVSGPYSRCFVIDPQQHASIIGVHFKPGGAFPFFGAPADKLFDTHLDLEVLWGRIATELRERLCAATTPARRFSLLEDALVSRLTHLPASHRAVPLALNMFEHVGEEVKVRDVARRVGLSQRRFIQVFAAEVGLTPKLFYRVRRFQLTRELVRNVDSPDWSRIAVSCGYCDQSHLIRDFQAFSGLSPLDYLRRASDAVLPNHVP